MIKLIFSITAKIEGAVSLVKVIRWFLVITITSVLIIAGKSDGKIAEIVAIISKLLN